MPLMLEIIHHPLKLSNNVRVLCSDIFLFTDIFFEVIELHLLSPSGLNSFVRKKIRAVAGRDIFPQFRAKRQMPSRSLLGQILSP